MQGLIGGFANGDPSAIQRRRAGAALTDYEMAEALLASVATRAWFDATGLTPGLLSTWTDLSGSSNDATAAGALRPTATGGTEVTFGGTQVMATPAFAMGARSSGALVARLDVDGGAFQYATPNGHTSVLAASPNLQQRSADGAATINAAYTLGTRVKVAWSYDASGGTVIVDGTPIAKPADGVIMSRNLPLFLGDLGVAVYALTGAINEFAIVDEVLTIGQLDTLYAGMAEKWA